VLFTLGTLGVYYFWAKTRTRRFLFSQTEFAGDRFAYHGTGRELLIGTLKALLVFGVPLLALYVIRERLDVPTAVKIAAGLVSSLTLLIVQLNEKDKDLGKWWKFILVVVLLFLSAMMVSTVKYPSFKSLGLRSTSTFIKAIGAALFIGLIVVLQEKILYYVLPAFFTLYLIYGFIRPRISPKVRYEIEEEEEDAPETGTS